MEWQWTSRAVTKNQNRILNMSKWLKSFCESPPKTPDKLLPEKTKDLVVHTKKISEVQEWFGSLTGKKPAPLLLVTGPPGCGKTVTIRTVAKEAGYEIMEWSNPVDVDYASFDEKDSKNSSNFDSKLNQFRQFLFRSSRYKPLNGLDLKYMILVEDFPNIFWMNCENLEGVLNDYKLYGKFPVVFTVTDELKDSNRGRNLFPEALCKRLQVTHIRFNPIANTLVRKNLKRVCSLMQQDDTIKRPNTDDVENIILSCQGDIRNAQMNLFFSLLKEPIKKQKSAKNTSKTKAKGTETATIKSVGRKEGITIHHAIGRVFRPKFSETGSKRFVHSPESIAEDFESEPRYFSSFLFSNYLLHYADTENVCEAADNLSISDVLLTEYKDEQIRVIGLNVATRAMMVNIQSRVTGWVSTNGFSRKNQDSSFKLDPKDLESRSSMSYNYRTYCGIITKK